MPAVTLDEVIRLADDLAPLDQVRLIEHLVPRLAQVVAGAQLTTPAEPGKGADAWDEFLRLGEDLARRDRPEIGTLTSAVVSSRRGEDRSAGRITAAGNAAAAQEENIE